MLVFQILALIWTVLNTYRAVRAAKARSRAVRAQREAAAAILPLHTDYAQMEKDIRDTPLNDLVAAAGRRAIAQEYPLAGDPQMAVVVQPDPDPDPDPYFMKEVRKRFLQLQGIPPIILGNAAYWYDEGGSTTFFRGGGGGTGSTTVRAATCPLCGSYPLGVYRTGLLYSHRDRRYRAQSGWGIAQPDWGTPWCPAGSNGGARQAAIERAAQAPDVAVISPGDHPDGRRTRPDGYLHADSAGRDWVHGLDDRWWIQGGDSLWYPAASEGPA